jgi:hypothetical protein
MLSISLMPAPLHFIDQRHELARMRRLDGPCAGTLAISVTASCKKTWLPLSYRTAGKVAAILTAMNPS